MIRRELEKWNRMDIGAVESRCRNIYREPLSDCFNTILRLASSPRTKGNDQAFKLLFAQNYGLDPDDLDSTILIAMRDSVIAITSRRPRLPDYIYLIATDESVSSPIAMVWTEEESRDITFDLGIPESSDPTRTIKLHSVFTGPAAREQLDALYPGAADMLFQHLPGAKREDSGWEDIDLLRIWPVAVPDR